MTTTQLSKQDYLKKYLPDGDKKKKKKKKVTQNSVIKSKIIDDDIDLKNMQPVDSDDLEIYDLAEEAPQIVGIIDDRPEEVRLLSEYRTKKWKVVADEFGLNEVQVTEKEEQKNGGSPRKETEVGETSPRPRKIKTEKSDSDASPPRKSNRRKSDSDPPSPPRKVKREKSTPPRRKSRKGESDSPPRRVKKEKSDSDASPPRKVKKEKTRSGSGDRTRKRQQRRDSDPLTPPRKSKRRKSDSPDLSPPRHGKSKHGRDKDSSRRRRSRSRSGSRRGRNREEEESKTRNTLSGKKSGLQNAEELRKEIEEMRERQKEESAMASGRDEAVVVRDRKTGQRIDPKEEARKRREKEEKEAEKVAQYAVWGKGVKQVQDSRDKLMDDLYEMSKPLARYADDKDLDDMLKNKEWDGDPMLEYIRNKRKKKGEGSGQQEQERKQYEGSYMPNRYGIRPGHRWDGVDRSNGYEKRWFDEQNARKAREEEAFKWSTADM